MLYKRPIPSTIVYILLTFVKSVKLFMNRYIFARFLLSQTLRHRPPFCFGALSDFPVNQFNFNFLHSISTFCTQFQLSALFGINWRALSQWACRNFCMYGILLIVQQTWSRQWKMHQVRCSELPWFISFLGLFPFQLQATKCY